MIFESRFEVDFGASFAPFWYRFGIIVEILEGFGRLLGALGRLLDRLGRVLGAVWRVLGASSARQKRGRAEQKVSPGEKLPRRVLGETNRNEVGPSRKLAQAKN